MKQDDCLKGIVSSLIEAKRHFEVRFHQIGEIGPKSAGIEICPAGHSHNDEGNGFVDLVIYKYHK